MADKLRLKQPKRLAFLLEQYGAALHDAFVLDKRNAPFLAMVQSASGKQAQSDDAIDAVFTRYRDADPTRNGAYTQWLIRHALAGNLPVEDLSKARETLEAFQTYRRRLHEDRRDLGRYETMGDVWNAVKHFVWDTAPVSGKDEDRREREAARLESEIILEQDGWTVAIPLTERAACWWGRGTRWCTASTRGNNMFTHYAKDGALVVFVRPDGAKFQFHAPSSQFMDANDDRASAAKELAGIVDALQRIRPALTFSLFHAMTGLSSQEEADDAVSVFGLHLWSIPQEFRSRDVCLTDLKRRPDVFSLIPDTVLDREIAEVAVAANGGNLQHIPKRMIDRDLCLLAVDESASYFVYVPENLRDQELSLNAVRRSGDLLEFVPEHLRDQEMCRAAVQSRGTALKWVPEPLRTSDLCWMAVRRSAPALEHIPQSLRDATMCSYAVAVNGRTLQWVPEPLRDQEMCMTAVKTSGFALQYVPSALRTPDLCRLALEWSAHMLEHVPENLRDEAMCRDAVRRQIEMFKHVPKRIMTRAFCVALALESPFSVRFIPEEFRDEEMWRTLVTHDPALLAAIPEEGRTLEICVAALTAIDDDDYPRMRKTLLSTEVPAHLMEEVERLARHPDRDLDVGAMAVNASLAAWLDRGSEIAAPEVTR